MKKLKILQLVIIILIAGFVGYYFGSNNVKIKWSNYHPLVSLENKEPPAGLQNVDFSLFWKVWQKLEATYYDKQKIDPQKMVNGAIEGVTRSLDDPYTIYLSPKQNSNFKEGLAGEFSGIGAELGTRDKEIIVVAPLSGSPAEKAGIKPGDAIAKVNGELTIDWSLPATVEKIRGPKGTTVDMTVIRKNVDKPIDLKIVRDTIKVKSVEGWVKKIKDIEGISSLRLKEHGSDKIAYIRLSQFGDATNEDWVALVNKLKLQMQENKEVKGLVVDLRNNPGGYLTDAVFIAGEFLKEGTPVVIEENGQGAKSTISVSRKGLLYDVSLILLINKGSASASEIVAGALRDNNRAKLVGEKTFGKGTIQEATDLGNGAGIHITVAKWLTPNSTWVHKVGLKPDTEVLLDSKDQSHDTQLEKAIEVLLK